MSLAKSIAIVEFPLFHGSNTLGAIGEALRRQARHLVSVGPSAILNLALFFLCTESRFRSCKHFSPLTLEKSSSRQQTLSNDVGWFDSRPPCKVIDNQENNDKRSILQTPIIVNDCV